MPLLYSKVLPPGQLSSVRGCTVKNGMAHFFQSYLNHPHFSIHNGHMQPIIGIETVRTHHVMYNIILVCIIIIIMHIIIMHIRDM